MNSSSNEIVIYLLHFYFYFTPTREAKKKDKVRKESQTVSGICNHKGKAREYKSSASQNSGSSYGYHTGTAILG